MSKKAAVPGFSHIMLIKNKTTALRAVIRPVSNQAR